MSRHTSFPEGRGTGTPWGPAHSSTVLARGCVAYTTGSHGGVSVTINWARKNLTPHGAHLGSPWGGKLWYEEDCQIVILFLEHPEFYREFHPDSDYYTKNIAAIRDEDEAQVRKYFPKYHDPEYQTRCRENPVFDPRDLISGDVVVLHGIGYCVTEPEDAKGRIHFAGGIYARRAVVIAGLSRVTRAGTVTWSLPK